MHALQDTAPRLSDAEALESELALLSADDGLTRPEASLHPDEAALVMQAIDLARGIGGPRRARSIAPTP